MSLTLLDHLSRIYPNAKRTTLRRMVEARRVSINGNTTIIARHPVAESDVVVVKSDRARPRPIKAPLPIVFEDEHIIVINKPPGLLTSTVAREKRPTAFAMLKSYVRAREPRAQVGLIHRLDADASGLLIFSKNHNSFLSLKRQFLRHGVDRIYMAVVEGIPTPRKGKIESRLVERADGSVHSGGNSRKGQRAITYYETITTVQNRSMVRVKLQTGRKHQIRVHLSERAVPIVNDPVYGKSKPLGRLMLVATELAVDHPHMHERMTFKIDFPSEWNAKSSDESLACG
ncbi:MAG TPA: RluA family pseudouridine synthase [Tepidisphaeraceae bacterium]|nr:RluA family pseudouridine synthase [Tepidisphaeraceae bacterium]